MVNSEPPPRRPPSTEGGSEARDVSNPVMANITKYQHIIKCLGRNGEKKFKTSLGREIIGQTSALKQC